MKKHLIVAAVAAAVAVPAAAQVTVYGIIDQGFTGIDRDVTVQATGVTTTDKQKASATGSVYSTQRIGFRGEEDLGGGLKASFVYEFGVNKNDTTFGSEVTSASTAADVSAAPYSVDGGSDTAAPLNARVATIGVSGGFGSVTIGRQAPVTEAAWGVGDVGGSNNVIGRAYTSGGKLNNSRSDRLIKYVSPAFSGFRATLEMADGTNERGGTASTSINKQKETGMGIAYSGGPLNVTVAQTKEKGTLAGAEVAGARLEQRVLGANYNLGMARVFATMFDAYSESAAGAKTNDKDGYELGLSVPMGAITLNASILRSSTKNTTTLENDVNGHQLAALYALSKRTTLYAVLGNDETKVASGTTTNSKTERDQIAIGLRHSF